MSSDVFVIDDREVDNELEPKSNKPDDKELNLLFSSSLPFSIK